MLVFFCFGHPVPLHNSVTFEWLDLWLSLLAQHCFAYGQQKEPILSQIGPRIFWKILQLVYKISWLDIILYNPQVIIITLAEYRLKYIVDKVKAMDITNILHHTVIGWDNLQMIIIITVITKGKQVQLNNAIQHTTATQLLIVFFTVFSLSIVIHCCCC